jgi:hypothetical protein
MEDHQVHIDEETGHLSFQPLRSQEQSISLRVEELLIRQADTIRQRLHLDETAINQIMEHALVQGLEILEWRLTRHPECEDCKRALVMSIQARTMVWHP